MFAPRSILAFVSPVFVLALAGCGPDDYNPGPETCDRSEERNPPVLYTEGTVLNGVYMTSDWDGELLWFPGGMHYELEHKLGDVPRFYQAYLSFNRHGTEDEGTIAQAAGSQVELVRADTETMVVRNAECVDYWLLVVASTGSP
ncbi:MAG: hypothetical protein IPK82_44395 [Polyangiaceae bacterium]|nr:hypothetical protein [Polyangiaceae bacterium]